MKTAIIPCCCPKIISGKPAFLFNTKNGVTILEQNLRFLSEINVDEIYIVFDSDKFLEEINDIIKKFKTKIIKYLINYKTSCVVETIYKTIINFNIHGGLIIKDGDTVAKCNLLNTFNNGASCINVNKLLNNVVLEDKSYIIHNNNNILDLVEKVVVSDTICTGIYCFEKTSDFLCAYEALAVNFYKEKINLYVSHIISYLLNLKKEKFYLFDTYLYEESLIETSKTNIALVDFDGTLVDTLDANYLSYKEAIKKITNLQLSKNDFKKKCFGKKYDVFLSKIFPSITKETIESIHNLKTNVYMSYFETIKVNEGLVELLKNIKKSFYICCVTTASKKTVIDILSKKGILSIFDSVFTQEDVENPKPNLEIYKLALSKYHLKFENAIIFEDNPMAKNILENNDEKLNVVTITF